MINILLGIVLIIISSYFACDSHDLINNNLWNVQVMGAENESITSSEQEIVNSTSVDVLVGAGIKKHSDIDKGLLIIFIVGIIVTMCGIYLTVTNIKRYH